MLNNLLSFAGKCNFKGSVAPAEAVNQAGSQAQLGIPPAFRGFDEDTFVRSAGSETAADAETKTEQGIDSTAAPEAAQEECNCQSCASCTGNE